MGLNSWLGLAMGPTTSAQTAIVCKRHGTSRPVPQAKIFTKYRAAGGQCRRELISRNALASGFFA